MSPKPLTWAALFAMVSTTGGCFCESTTCNTDQLPTDDPCYNRPCCDVITVVPTADGGVAEVPPGTDGGPDAYQRFCGACNG